MCDCESSRIFAWVDDSVELPFRYRLKNEMKMFLSLCWCMSNLSTFILMCFAGYTQK